MKKLAPLVLALSLAARSLFGNTGDLLKEIQEKKQPFSLETTLTAQNPAENFNSNFNISGEYNFDAGYKIRGELEIENNLPSKAVLAAGNPNIYLGAKWENLSLETTLLKDANLFKLELGVRDIANFLNLSPFVAYTSIPNMKTRWTAYGGFDTPLQLYTFGVDGIAKPKFELKKSTITPWISGKILINGPIAKNTEWIYPTYDDSSFAWAFNHFTVGLGAELNSKNLDLGLENYWDGSYYPFMSGTIHKARAVLHDEKNKNSLGYAFTANPQFNWLGWPANWDLQSEIDFKLSLPSGIYLKSISEINHSNLGKSNTITVLGYSSKTGNNLELFYNLQDKLLGITLAMKELGNNKERYSKDEFYKMKPSFRDLYSSEGDHSGIIPGFYGENISNVVNYIKSNSTDYKSAMQEISEYASYFKYREHVGTFSAEKEHDEGYGVCRDTNGILLPTVINGVLGSQGYKSWGKGFFGPYIGHALTIIKKPNNRYDIMDYENVYFLDAKTEQEAIDKVYPGAHAYDGGKYSETSQRVINALEESVWK